MSITQHLTSMLKEAEIAMRQQSNVKHAKGLTSFAADVVGEDQEQWCLLSLCAVNACLVPWQIHFVFGARYCHCHYPASMRQFSFSKGEIFHSFINPIYIDFKFSKAQIALSFVFQWHVDRQELLLTGTFRQHHRIKMLTFFSRM